MESLAGISDGRWRYFFSGIGDNDRERNGGGFKVWGWFWRRESDWCAVPIISGETLRDKFSSFISRAEKGCDAVSMFRFAGGWPNFGTDAGFYAFGG